MTPRTPPGGKGNPDSQPQPARQRNAATTDADALITRNAQLEREFAQLRGEHTDLQRRYAEAQREIVGLRQQLGTVAGDVATLKEDQVAMKATLNKVSAGYTDEDGERARTDRGVQRANQDYQDLKDQVHRMQRTITLQRTKLKNRLVVRTAAVTTPNELQRKACEALTVSDTTIISTEAVPIRNRPNAAAAPAAAVASSSAAPPPPMSNADRPPLHTYILTFTGHAQAEQALQGGRLKRGLAALFPAGTYINCDWWLTKEELQERNKLLPEKQRLHQQGVVACWRGVELWQLLQDATGRKHWAQWTPAALDANIPTA